MGFAQWPLLLVLVFPILGLIICATCLLRRRRTATKRQQQQMQQQHRQSHYRRNSIAQMWRSSSRLGFHTANDAERGEVRSPETALVKEPIHQVMYQHWRSQSADDLGGRMQASHGA